MKLLGILFEIIFSDHRVIILVAVIIVVFAFIKIVAGFFAEG